MGKKARKTRWRTLAIADEQSDSEESNTTTASRLPKTYQQKSHYNKLPYSSQSTPRRRYQHDGTKSTRSSSTASENKITFNEDEYTRITTPRQDVLFKKGYLNKPRTYQTQTSTGTSTTSTGNSTGNGTPDHQSTDLEYESQFVFPNGFVDQNGIYYVNSFEPYPLMLYNPPTYYPEFSNSKSKRCSTGSLTESTSPNNEEATSQDLSGGEASNNVSDYSSHRSVYSMVYHDYYANGICPSQEMVNEHCPTDQIRKIKKRRRRKTSRSLTAAPDSTECSDDDSDACAPGEVPQPAEKTPPAVVDPTSTESLSNPSTCEITTSVGDAITEEKLINGCAEKAAEGVEKDCETPPATAEVQQEESSGPHNPEVHPEEHPQPHKYDLKPDAAEFVPRAFRPPEIPISPIQFIKVPPNFVHIPVVPFNGQNFNPAFIPSGIPVHFLPPDHKMYPNFVGFAPNVVEVEEKGETTVETTSADQGVREDCDISDTAKEEAPICRGATDKHSSTKKTIDIATVVSKLEEAVKEREEVEVDVQSVQSPKRTQFEKEYRASPKYKNNYKRSFYNSPRDSPPQRQVYHNGTTQEHTTPVPAETQDVPEGAAGDGVQAERKFNRNSPEKFKKYWKPYHQNGTIKLQPNGVQRSPEFKQRQNYKTYTETKQNTRNYSATLRNSAAYLKPAETNDKDIAPDCKKVESPTTEEAKSPKTFPKSSAPSPATPNQWISVSSKKKRKNKNMEETDAAFEVQEETPVDDDFEMYDINLLVDVVPSATPAEDVIKVEITEGKVEEMINTIAESLPTPIENNSLIPNIRSVADIESELIIREPEQVEQENVQTQPPPTPSEVVNDAITEEFTAVDKSKSKKKSKKGPQKAVTKRVIITDIDLSDKYEQTKTPMKKVVKTIERAEEKPKTVEAVGVSAKIEEVIEKPIPPSPVVAQDDGEDDKKKSKKKKKKPSKSVTSDSSLAGSTATLNVAESYDFLLDASLADEVDKTNDEISQELDKIIQKGMYSNLEEKMKSLNIDESEGFFKSVFSKITTRDSIDKAGYAKTPDFTKIPLFKPASVSEDHPLENKQSNTQLTASESPREDGIFLDNPDLNKVLQKSEDVNTKAKNVEIGNTKEEDKSEEARKLYPITAAVKEWMSKTRETTPDVDILKSPKTIYKELHESVCSQTAGDSSCPVSRNFIKEHSTSIDGDEEITLFAKNREDSEAKEDLLDFWENEVTNEVTLESDTVSDVVEVEVVDQGEDALEIYESKYGKNEDYLNLQKEIREKTKNINHPKHSNLPYRAVCCNIM